MTRSMLTLLLCAMASWAWAAPASAAAGGAATDACERFIQDTLREARGPTAAAVFSAPPAAQPGAVDAAEVTLRGGGQVRTPSGSRPFNYSCTFDTRTGTVAGAVVRDGGAPEQAAAARSVEPDLSHVSPTACESAAATTLKRRWPNVARISFDADTRELSQVAGGAVTLRGQGTALPSVRDPATHFSYDCAIDPRNGRVASLRLVD